MKTFFRRMVSADLEMVRKWRNNAHVLKMSGNDQEITAEEHKNWFFNIPGERFIFEFNDQPSGVMTFKPLDTKSAEWSFYLDQSHPLPRGTGHLMLSTAIVYARLHLSLSVIKARVKTWNAASIRLHQRLDFLLKETHDDEMVYWKIL